MITNILLALAVLIILAKLLGELFERIGLDSTLGELLTGILFGPILHLIHADTIENFAILGSVLILFIAGLKISDASELYENPRSISLALLLLIPSLALMSLFFHFLGPLFNTPFTWTQSLFLGLAFSVIDVAVPAKVLLSKGLFESQPGRIVLNASIVNIIAGLLLLTLFTLLLNPTPAGIFTAGSHILLFLALLFLLTWGFSKLSLYFIRFHVEEAQFSFSLVLLLLLAYFTEVLGFSSVLGAFIAGILVAKTPEAEHRAFSEKLKALSFGLFIPLFFAWFGLELNLQNLLTHIGFGLLIFIVYTTYRFLTTYAFCKKHGYSTPGILSSSMLSVDVESLVILLMAMQLGVFTNDLALSLFAPSVLLSTLAVVALVSLFSRSEKPESSKV